MYFWMRLTRPPVMLFGAGVGEGDAEALLAVDAVIMDLGVLPEADGEVVVHGLVVEEVFFDHVAAIAQAEHEVAEAVVGVESS